MFKNIIENVQSTSLISYKLNLPISNNLQISHVGFASCELRTSVADIVFFFDLLSGFIYSPKFLSMNGFKTPNRCLRKTNFFQVSFYRNNYSFASFFNWTLKLAIADRIKFFLCHVTFQTQLIFNVF